MVENNIHGDIHLKLEFLRTNARTITSFTTNFLCETDKFFMEDNVYGQTKTK